MKHQEVQVTSTEPTYEYMTVDGSWVRLHRNPTGTAFVAEIERTGRDGKPVVVHQPNMEFSSVDEAMACLFYDFGYLREGERGGLARILTDAKRYRAAWTLVRSAEKQQ